MGLRNFIAALQPNQNNKEKEILSILKSVDSDLEIYWYPGSGDDVTPLLFDVPNNPTGRRLLRKNNDGSEQPPILLWMNDCADSLVNFPSDSQLNREVDSQYSELWNLYQASGLFGSYKEIYSLGDCGFTLFSVNIKNAGHGPHSRPHQGDDYIILFSNQRSEDLLEKVFLEYKIRINTIALIKQGGFSGQTFGHYNLPQILKEKKEIGSVDFWIIDSQGVCVDSEKKIVSSDLDDYEYIGGPVPWGWAPARMFGRKGRKGVPYEIEKRPMRTGRSWRG